MYCCGSLVGVVVTAFSVVVVVDVVGLPLDHYFDYRPKQKSQTRITSCATKLFSEILLLSLLTLNDPVFRLVAVVWACTVRHEYQQQIRSRGEYLCRQVKATVAANKSIVR